MASSQATNIGLYYGWTLGESGFNVQMDYNWQAIDALLCVGVKSATTVTPPASPAAGDRYLVPSSSATGAWTSGGAKLTIWTGAAWLFFPPKNGMTVLAIDDGQTYVRSGSSWVLDTSLLGSYTRDTTAATGGVAVGEKYIKTSSGAITVRQT